jgi:hypothetical protein
MSTLSIRIPDSLHRAVRELADDDQVSINQFIAFALTEKVASLRTVDYLRQRANQAKLSDFDRLLSMVPDAESDAADTPPSTNNAW